MTHAQTRGVQVLYSHCLRTAAVLLFHSILPNSLFLKLTVLHWPVNSSFLRNHASRLLIMAQVESISLQESLPPDAPEHELQDGEQDASRPDQGNSRLQESKTTRFSVLVGSGVLQLPIWGTLNRTFWLQFYLRT